MTAFTRLTVECMKFLVRGTSKLSLALIHIGDSFWTPSLNHVVMDLFFSPGYHGHLLSHHLFDTLCSLGTDYWKKNSIGSEYQDGKFAVGESTEVKTCFCETGVSFPARSFGSNVHEHTTTAIGLFVFLFTVQPACSMTR